MNALWGGLADTLRHDCSEASDLDPLTAQLLERLDELANCRSVLEIAEFCESSQSFTTRERDYLISPLLDQIYCTLRERLPSHESGLVSATDQHKTCEENKQARYLDLALPVTCIKGYVHALSFFAARGADINATHAIKDVLPAASAQRLSKANLSSSIAPLALAACSGQTECVTRLLALGANVHAFNNQALFVAALNGHGDVIQALLEGGADVHDRVDESIAMAHDLCGKDAVSILRDASRDVHEYHDRILMAVNGLAEQDIVALLMQTCASMDFKDLQQDGRSFGLDERVTALLRNDTSSSALNMELTLD